MGLVIVLGSMVHSGCVFISKSLNCVDNKKILPLPITIVEKIVYNSEKIFFGSTLSDYYFT